MKKCTVKINYRGKSVSGRVWMKNSMMMLNICTIKKGTVILKKKMKKKKMMIRMRIMRMNFNF